MCIINFYFLTYYRQAMILDGLLTFFVAFSTLVCKIFFSQSISIHIHLSLVLAHVLEFDHPIYDTH